MLEDSSKEKGKPTLRAKELQEKLCLDAGMELLLKLSELPASHMQGRPAACPAVDDDDGDHKLLRLTTLLKR
jgi:hypothetical protein